MQRSNSPGRIKCRYSDTTQTQRRGAPPRSMRCGDSTVGQGGRQGVEPPEGRSLRRSAERVVRRSTVSHPLGTASGHCSTPCRAGPRRSDVRCRSAKRGRSHRCGRRIPTRHDGHAFGRRTALDAHKGPIRAASSGQPRPRPRRDLQAQQRLFTELHRAGSCPGRHSKDKPDPKVLDEQTAATMSLRQRPSHEVHRR